jgi:uncharacterized integral membrane protein
MADSAELPGQGSARHQPPRKQSRRDIVRMVIFALGLVLLIAFVLANSHQVKVGFVVTSTRLSLIWVLLIAAVLGALVDRLVILLRQRRKKAPKAP